MEKWGCFFIAIYFSICGNFFLAHIFYLHKDTHKGSEGQGNNIFSSPHNKNPLIKEYLQKSKQKGKWQKCADCQEDQPCDKSALWHAKCFPKKIVASKNETKIHVVVSHCVNDLSWLSKFTRGYTISSIHVISNCGKSVEGAPKGAVIHDLPNVGRNDHSYVYYINNVLEKCVERSDRKRTKVFFLKDDMSKENMSQKGTWNSFETMLGLSSSTNGFACGVSKTLVRGMSYSAFHDTKSLFTFTMKKYDRNIKGYAEDTSPFQSNFTTFGSFFESHFQLNLPELVQVCYGGVFAASYSNIVQLDASALKKVEKTLSRGNNIQEGHYMERAWGPLLATPDLKAHQIEFLRNRSIRLAPYSYTGALVTKIIK